MGTHKENYEKGKNTKWPGKNDMPSSEDAETCICIASINEYFIRQAALNVKLQQKASPISVKPDEKSRKKCTHFLVYW